MAGALYRALGSGRRQIAAGETDAAVVRERAAACIPSDPRIHLEYLELVDPEEMQPVRTVAGPVRIAGALWVGATRLIDNVLCAPAPPRGYPGKFVRLSNRSQAGPDRRAKDVFGRGAW